MAGEGAARGLTQVLATELVRDGYAAIDRLGDEIAKIVPAVQTIHYRLASGTVDTAVTAGVQTWHTLGNITVPAWATRASVYVSCDGMWPLDAGVGVTKLALYIGSSACFLDNLNPPPAVSNRFNWANAGDVAPAPTPGVQSVTLKSSWTSGLAYRSDTRFHCSALIAFSPVNG